MQILFLVLLIVRLELDNSNHLSTGPDSLQKIQQVNNDRTWVNYPFNKRLDILPIDNR